MSLHGVFPILPTPFDHAGAVDEASMRRLIDFELAVDAHGVSVLGFMGEADAACYAAKAVGRGAARLFSEL